MAAMLAIAAETNVAFGDTHLLSSMSRMSRNTTLLTMKMGSRRQRHQNFPMI